MFTGTIFKPNKTIFIQTKQNNLYSNKIKSFLFKTKNLSLSKPDHSYPNQGSPSLPKQIQTSFHKSKPSLTNTSYIFPNQISFN